jgi:LPXTG-motif cell wall-anchored protein
MPLLDTGNGFLVAIGLMVSVASLLGVVFWRRRWLG